MPDLFTLVTALPFENVFPRNAKSRPEAANFVVSCSQTGVAKEAAN